LNLRPIRPEAEFATGAIRRRRHATIGEGDAQAAAECAEVDVQWMLTKPTPGAS
jgi:hypothetical protein